jgi:Bacterial extracellular solute-binding proteins, family 5 Middle
MAPAFSTKSSHRSRGSQRPESVRALHLSQAPSSSRALAETFNADRVKPGRCDVKFHNGESFTADDVVFSIGRIKAEGSDVGYTFATVTAVRKIDALTVDLVMDKPNPILPLQTTSSYIMSKSWAEANGAAAPASVKNRVENFATNNANGTGPFKIKSRHPALCLRFFSCLGRLSPNCSSRDAGLKSRISSFGISSILF